MELGNRVPQIYYIAAELFPENKCEAGFPPPLLHSAIQAVGQRVKGATAQLAESHGNGALQHKVRCFQAAVPLLDTSKLVHIWYTTKTTRGWSLLEFNDSSVVIWNMQSGLLSSAAHFSSA